VTAQHDDPLGAEPARGDDAAQADRAVPDDRHDLARADFGSQCGVMPRPHHVRECQERRHQRVIGSYGQCDQRPIGQRDPHRFALAAIELGAAPPAAVKTGGLQSLLAELASAVGPGKWSDDEVALLDRSDCGAEILDETDELVAHPVADLAGCHGVVRPQIAAADTGTRDANQGVGWLDESGVGNRLDAHIVRAVHHRCSHVDTVLPLQYTLGSM